MIIIEIINWITFINNIKITNIMIINIIIYILVICKRNIKFFYAGGNLKGKANAYREIQNKDDLEFAVDFLDSESIRITGSCEPYKGE